MPGHYADCPGCKEAVAGLSWGEQPQGYRPRANEDLMNICPQLGTKNLLNAVPGSW